MITTYSYFNLKTLKRVKQFVLPVSLILLFFSSIVTAQISQTFNTSGTFTVPAGVTSITVQAWGSGAAGNKQINRAGGGGAFAGNNSLTVTPGISYTVTVGIGAAAGSGANGQNSSFGTTLVVAAGGTVGNGGQASNSTGTILFSGGNGGTSSTTGGGSGGGGSAGTSANGQNGSPNSGNTGGVGGAGGTTLGGNGGNGGGHNDNGNTGAFPGGGGGEGGSNSSNISGGGGNGRVILTWTCPTYTLSSTSVATPLCIGNSATVTLTSSAAGLPIGTYTVTYNQSAPNLFTGETTTMSVTTAGAGSFVIPSNKLTNSGATTITITNLSSGSGTPNCSSIISANNTTIVTVTANMTATVSTPQTRCISNALTNITHTTTGATGILNSGVSGANGLPAGVSANWAGGTITISGTPTASGIFNYSIPLTGGCGTVNATGTITVNAIPSAPLVNSITQPTCTVGTGSVVLNGLPATGNWTLTRSPGAITTNGTGTSTTISGLSPGTYTYSVIGSNNGTGLNAEYFNNMTLSGVPALTRTDATVNFDWVNGGPGAPIGNDNFSVRWSGQIQPLYSQNYTFTTRSDDGIRLWVNGMLIINNWTDHPATDNTGTINLTAGIKYDIVLEYYENGGQAVAQLSWSSASQTLQIIPQSQLYPTAVCSSLASADVVINAQPVTPTAPTVGTITQPTCATSTGSVVLNGLPATGTWIINPGAITGTGTSTTISGLAASTTYNYTVTNAAGCVSTASANVVINTQPVTPTAPTVGTITQPTCATSTGSVVLNGLPATGTWIINPGAITGTGTSTTISGLAASTTYNYTVTNAAGCVSTASANVVINTQPVTPTAPTVGTITQPTCATSTGSVVLNGLPATGTWIINPGAITGTGTSTTISGLAASTTYNYTVTNAAGCVSTASANVVINTQPVTPTAPTVGTITQPTCATSTGSVVLNGLPATGTWIINPGAITGTGTSTTISGLSPGTYTYSVIGSNNGTGLNAEYFNNMTLSGVPALTRTDATVNFDWVNGGPGAPIGNDNFSVRWSGQLLPLYSQNYTFTTRSDDGIRLWVNGMLIINNWTDHPATDNTGTINLTAGIKYDIVLEYYENGGQAVAQLSWNSASQTLQIIPQSQLYPTAVCSSLASANVVINTQPSTPTAPTVGTITQPTCATSTGSVVLNGLPASGTWTINPGAITGTGTSTTISGLAASTTYNYTVTNAAGCVSTASANVVINTQPSTPTAPTVGTITQPTCATSTGSVVLNGLPASGTWTINPGAITGTGTSTTISGLAASTTYNYTVTNAAGCVSTASANVVINTQPANNVWNGSVSTDWNTAGNWCVGVPSISNNLDVLIPTSPTGNRFPILNSNPEGYVKNIVFESGTTLIIENNTLFVEGILTLNGKIDLNNESQLVQGNVSTFDSASTGTLEIDQQGTSDNFKYNYWGSPVNAIGTNYTIAGVLRDGSFPSSLKTIDFGAAFTYADTKVIPTLAGPSIKLSAYWMYKFTNKAAGDYNAWTAVGKDGVLKPGEGFTLKGSNSTFAEQNYTFVGKPNNGDINLMIDAGKQYLIGNPYPSAIDAKQFIEDNIKIDATGKTGNRSTNIIDGNLYFWDHFGGGTHFLKSYEGGYSIYNLSAGVNGGTKAISTDARIKVTSNQSSKSAQRFIPVAQGFFVTGLESGEIHFKNSQRIFKKENALDSQFLRNNRATKATKFEIAVEDNYPRIYLKYSSPTGLHRQILVAFIPNTTDGIDIGYDAINNEKFTEDMSWFTPTAKFIIQAVPTLDNDRVLPLEVKVATSGLAKISIDKLENIPLETDIFIKDNLNGMLYNLRNATFEINLSPGTYSNRFELLLQTQKSLAIEEESFIEDFVNIYLNNPESTIYINKNKSVEIKEINIHNMLGQQIKSIKKGFDTQTIKIPINAQSGVYIVNVITNNGTISKKVIKF